MQNKIYIRADASSEIGLGHIIRCIAFANYVKDNLNVTFIVKEIPDNLSAEIILSNFSLVKINAESELIELLSEKDFVLVDHYGLGLEYHNLVKEKGAILICIDDLHDKKFNADLIINHAPPVLESNYQTKSNCLFGLGLDYSLLRPSFIKQASSYRKIEKIDSFLICFGGSDSLNFSKKIASIILKSGIGKKITIVVGAGYQFLSDLQATFANEPKIEILSSLHENEMLQVMSHSDIAIVPASGILYEVIACGCQVITSYYVDNQKNIFEGFKKIPYITTLDSFDKLTIEFIQNFEIKDQKNPIDGKAGKRILDLINKLSA